MSNPLMSISSPDVLYIITNIKLIQQRMKDPEIVNMEYIRIYDTLSREFDDFFMKYTGIFARVTKGESLNVLASALYYKNKIEKGDMTESALSDKLASIYLTEGQKKDADERIKVMKANGEL